MLGDGIIIQGGLVCYATCNSIQRMEGSDWSAGGLKLAFFESSIHTVVENEGAKLQ